MYFNLERTQELIDKFNEIERDEWGELSEYIANEALEECYENDKQLHRLLFDNKTDVSKLKIVDETLISICGWSIQSLLEHILEEREG